MTRTSCGLRLEVWLTPVLLFVLAVLAGCATSGPQADAARAPKNNIILFGDGAAATQWELGRYTSRALRGKPFAITDVIFKEGNVGLLPAHSAESFVPHSAAAAPPASASPQTHQHT